MIFSILFILVGIALLYFGGEMLVKGSSKLARVLGLSPLVIGLTVVAFGTSSPELAATLVAALKGSPDLALGNVLGSNIANIGLILGLSVVLRPLIAQSQFVRREIPFMIFIAAILPLLALDGVLGHANGVFLLVLFVLYLWVLLRKGETPGGALAAEIEADEPPAAEAAPTGVVRNLLLVVVGIGLLVLGADLMVRGAVVVARALGLSEQVIGLTLVAFGTSLPELASSIVAVLRRESDILLGNIVGSNIFNVLLVLALTVTVHPVPAPLAAFGRDMGVGLFFSVLMIPLLFFGTRRQLYRLEGAILLLAYGVYVGWLFGGG